MSDLVPEPLLSSEMMALSPKARAFVLSLIEIGGAPQWRAAQMAGYMGTSGSLAVTASRLAADPRVQEALVTHAKAMARASGLMAVAEIVKIASDQSAGKQHRLNAAFKIASLAGLEPDKNVNVKHDITVTPSTAEQIRMVREMAVAVGIDPRRLLGRAGIVVDAEFSVVGDATGLEDIL